MQSDCVNDGSKDNSHKILEDYSSIDKRIKVFEQPNSGSGKARNLGLDNAIGEFIAFMDSDDKFPNDNTLKNMYTKAIENNVQVCGGSLSEMMPDGSLKTPRSVHTYFESEGILDYRDFQYDYGYYRFIFSLELLNNYNIRFPDYLRFQDPPFLVQAMVKAQKIYALTEDTYYYRWGHQDVKWNFRQVNDLTKGVRDNLVISSVEKLELLHENCVFRLSTQYKKILLNSLKEGNKELIFILLDTINCIDVELLVTHSKSPELKLKPLEEYLEYINLEQKVVKKIMSINQPHVIFMHTSTSVLTPVPYCRHYSLQHNLELTHTQKKCKM